MAHARQRARRGASMTTRRPIDAPRNAPSDAAAERALLFTPAVPRRSLGPHAWSRARVDRLAPRKESKPSGEGSPLPHTCTARRRRPFTAPKVDMLGSGGCSGCSPILAHISFDAAARERLAQWRHCPARPLYLKLVGIKIASVFDKIEISKQLSSPPRSQAPRC